MKYLIPGLLETNKQDISSSDIPASSDLPASNLGERMSAGEDMGCKVCDRFACVRYRLQVISTHHLSALHSPWCAGC